MDAMEHVDRELVLRFLALPLPKSDNEAIRGWARQLEPLGKPMWIRAARAALEMALSGPRRRHWPDEVLGAVRAVDDWIAAPGKEASARAASAAFEPKGLWMNCDDLGHCTRLASARLARAASSQGTIEDATTVIAAMCHPLAFDMNATLESVRDSVRKLLER
jgi:hypothetical protein